MAYFTKFKIVFIHFVLACIFSYFYLQVVPVFPFQEFDERFREVEGQISLILPVKATYLLKIWGRTKPVAVYFNNEPLIHFFFRERSDSEEFYYSLSKNKIREGKNTIKITSNVDYSVRIKNSINFNDFSAVLLKPIPGRKDHFSLSRPLSVFFVFLILQISIWLGWFFLSKRFFGLSFEKYCLGYILTFLPAFLFFFLAVATALFSPFSIFIFKLAFIKILLGSALIFQAFLFFGILKKKHSNKKNIEENLIEPEQSLRIKKLSIKFKEYGFVQWYMCQNFSDKCIFVFFVSLFSGSFLLAFYAKFLAEFFSIVGFLALFSAAIIKFRQVCKD